MLETCILTCCRLFARPLAATYCFIKLLIAFLCRLIIHTKKIVHFLYHFFMKFHIIFLKSFCENAADNRFELFHTDIPCIWFLTFKLSLFMLHMYMVLYPLFQDFGVLLFQTVQAIHLCLCRKSGTFQKKRLPFPIAAV